MMQLSQLLPLVQEQTQANAARAAGRKRSSAGGARKRSACPPALTGGESFQGQKSKLDWFTLTWLPSPDEDIGLTVHSLLNEVLSGGVMGEECPGMMGYEFGVRFYTAYMGDLISVARVDFGGGRKSGRARIDISGMGCSRILNWLKVKDWVSEQEEPRLTRVDLAVDCLDGEFTVDDCKSWYEAGDFSTHGRYPRHSCPGDWLSSPSVYGRTLEVGRRENGKMLRAYEKGKQLGDPSSPWVRFEVELRNNDRDLPFEILTEPDRFFTGAYGCLERVLPGASERIKTHQKEGEIALENAIEYAKTSYGQLVFCMRQFMTQDEIYDAIHRPGVPKRLEKAALGGFLNPAS